MARAGCLLISQDRQCLIVHEASHPITSRKWGLPKGKVNPNETKFQAALRELEEEVGVKASSLPMPTTSFRRKNLVIFVFFVDKHRLRIIPDNKEISTAVWISLDDLRERYELHPERYNVTITAIFEKYLY